jgi:hypothetical protein
MKKPNLVLEPGLTTTALLDSKTDLPRPRWCTVFFDWVDKVANIKWIEWYYCRSALGITQTVSEGSRLQDRCQEKGIHGTVTSFKDIEAALRLLSERCVNLEARWTEQETEVAACKCNPENVLRHATGDLCGVANRMFGLIAQRELKRLRHELPYRVVSRGRQCQPSVVVSLPNRVPITVELVSQFADFLQKVNPVIMLRAALNKEDGSLVLMAMRLQMSRILRQLGRPYDWECDIPEFSLGTEFSDSFKTIPDKDHLLVLDGCCKLILAKAGKITFEDYLDEKKHKRVLEHLEGPRRVRKCDRAEGWRLSLASYRINYWLTASTQRPELAWVGKKEFDADGQQTVNLPEGYPGAALCFCPPRRRVPLIIRKRCALQSLRHAEGI